MEEVIRLTTPQVVGDQVTVSIRCPTCHQRGTFEPIGVGDIRSAESPMLRLGHRRCPNAQCRAHIFFVMETPDRVIATYPPERIDFDSTNVPGPVLAALEEAIGCHASRCFIAAAIMIRKTLEELCADRGANGGNLKARLVDLGKTIVLPPALMDGLDSLRLLGNDAAHIESQEFNQVSHEEVEVAIEFAKEVLKAVYQYDALLQKLQALKRQET